MMNRIERRNLGFEELAVFMGAILFLFLTPALEGFGLLGGAGLLVVAWAVTIARGTEGARIVSALGLTALAFVVLTVAALGIGSFG